MTVTFIAFWCPLPFCSLFGSPSISCWYQYIVCLNILFTFILIVVCNSYYCASFAIAFTLISSQLVTETTKNTGIADAKARARMAFILADSSIRSSALGSALATTRQCLSQTSRSNTG